MESTTRSVRFQVIVNGEIMTTAGLEGYGVFNASVDWISRDPARILEWMREQSDFDEKQFTEKTLTLRVGGLDSGRDEHLIWLEEPLIAGDEITIRILPPGDSEEPTGRLLNTKLSKCTRNLWHLEKGLRADTATIPNDQIWPEDGRAITFNNVLDAIENDYPELTQGMRIEKVTHISVLHERVLKLQDALEDEQ